MSGEAAGGHPADEARRTRAYAALATAAVAACTVVGGALIFAIEHRAVGFVNVAAGLALAGVAFAVHRGARPPSSVVAALFLLSRAVAFHTEGLDASVVFRTVVFGLALYAALRPLYATGHPIPASPVP